MCSAVIAGAVAVPASVAVLSALLVAGLAILLLGEARGPAGRRLVWLGKPTASTAFLLLALLPAFVGRALDPWLVAAIGLCWLGDLLLIPDSTPVFRAGILAFLAGHAAFAAAFVARGVNWAWVVAAAVPLAVAGFVVGRFFGAKAGAALRGAVAGYVVAISAMVALAAGTVGTHGSWTFLLAASAFYANDLLVARHRFVQPQPVNRLVGLPLYYAAMLLFAFATALPE